MILSRRPFTIFDVDLAFAAGLVIIVILGFVLFVRPALARQQAVVATRQNLQNLQGQVEERRGEIAELQGNITRLKAGVEQRAADIPSAAASEDAILQLVGAARDLGFTFQQILPREINNNEGRVTRDVQFEAHAPANDAIRWLDDCARRHPYVTFLHLQMQQAGDTCKLTGRLRLHLLPEPIPVTAEPAP